MGCFSSSRVQRGMILLIGMLANILAGFQMASPAVLVDQIAQNMRTKNENVVIFSSIYFCAYAISLVFLSAFADMMNPGYITCISSMIISIGSIIIAFSKDFYLSCAARFVTGIGCSSSYTTVAKVLSNWYEQKSFNVVNSLIIACHAIGSLIAQGPLANAVLEFHWTWWFITMSLLGTVLAMLSAVFIKEKPGNEEDANASSSIETGTQQNNNPRAQENERKRYCLIFTSAFKHLLSNGNLRKLAVWLCLSRSFFLLFTAYWSIPYLRSVFKFDIAKSSNISMILNFAGIFFGPIFTLISGCIKTKKWLIFGLTIGELACVIIPVFITKNTLILIVCLVFAVYGGCSVASATLCITQITESVPHDKMATSLGFVLFLPYIFTFVEENLIVFFMQKIDGGSFEFYSAKAYQFGMWLLGVLLIAVALIVVAFFKVDPKQDVIKKTASPLLGDESI